MVKLDSRLGRFYRAFYGWAAASPSKQKVVGYAGDASSKLRNPRRTNLDQRCNYASTGRFFDTASPSSRSRRPDGTFYTRADRVNISRNYSQVEAGRQTVVEEQSQTSLKDPAALGQLLRVALRRLTQPVVVITAANLGQKSDAFEHFRGVTVSSFSSITLKPKPYICFNIKLPSRTWDAIEAQDTIYVHFLSANSGGMSIAHAFTQPHEHPAQPFRDLQQAGVSVETPLPQGPPALVDWSRILARISAKVDHEKCVNVGDHVLVVAEVIDVTESTTEEEPGNFALSYGLGKYRSGGESLGLSETPIENKVEGTSSNQISNTPRSSIAARLPQARHFSTINSLHKNVVVEKKFPELQNLVADPSLLEQTVGDFMGVFKNPETRSRAPGGMRQLVKLKKEADEALKQLESLSNEGKSDSVEAIELNRLHIKNERFVLKTLAQRSAADLRQMLDSGKVDYRLTDYMEATIEKGQALLLEETERLRLALQHGMIDERKFREVGRQMQADYEVMREVTGRLKAITEDDDGGPFGD